MSMSDQHPPVPDDVHEMVVTAFQLGLRIGERRYWTGYADALSDMTEAPELPPARCHPRGTRPRPRLIPGGVA
jgi:hypothetical protein